MLNYYIFGAFTSLYFISGIVFSDIQFAVPRLAKENIRKDAGHAILIGLLLSLFWPIGIIAAFCFSGFAEHGIWKSPKYE